MLRPHAAGAQRHVLCMKWGTKYGPDYVNRLYAMVRRHLIGDFNFVCLTDNAEGIRSIAFEAQRLLHQISQLLNKPTVE